MRKLLITAASMPEIRPFAEFLETHYPATQPFVFHTHDLEICLSVSGVGMMQAAAGVMESIMTFRPDVAVQAGIAGAFNRDLPLGSLVIVNREMLGDTGAEDHQAFLDIFDLGLMPQDGRIFTGRALYNPMRNLSFVPDLSAVSALSVNMASGSAATIQYRAARYGCDIESMEGAAFHYVCLKKKIPFLQIRSISNYVTPRDKSQWKMKEAIDGLNEWLVNHFSRW